MDLSLPAAIERLPRQKTRLIAACRVGEAEPDVIGMAIAGSFAEGTADSFSDLDLRVVLKEGSFERLFSRREDFARACGPLIAAFTGEHVGESHLLITLYDDMIHVDYLFVELADAPTRNDGRTVQVLWQRDPRVTAALSRPVRTDPAADLAYLEARVWTWTWYIQSKILRGELWEAAAGVAMIREAVLFRLLALRRGIRYRGSRFAEQVVGEYAGDFNSTLSSLDRESLLEALRTAVKLYVELADPLLDQYGVARAARARSAVLDALAAGLNWFAS
jgi:Streptomycin adenylyltransferase